MIKYDQLARLCNRAMSNKTFEVGNVQVLITKTKREGTIVTVRGTQFDLSIESIKDILANLKAFPKNTKDCGKVHGGVYKAAKAASRSLELYITQEEVITLNGHSFGGGVALLMAKILKGKGYNIANCATFGSPKVVHEKSIQDYKDLNLVQYINYGDVLTDFPGRWWKYEHVAKQYIGTKGSEPSWKRHDIDEYIELLSHVQ